MYVGDTVCVVLVRFVVFCFLPYRSRDVSPVASGRGRLFLKGRRFTFSLSLTGFRPRSPSGAVGRRALSHVPSSPWLLMSERMLYPKAPMGLADVAFELDGVGTV